MLNHSLSTLAQRLDEYLRISLSLDETITSVSYLRDIDGKMPEESRNKLVFNILNPQFENTIHSINFQLLLVANFEDYDQSLHLLGHSLNFFRASSVFTPANTPGLPKEIDKIVMETAEEVDVFHLKELWSLFGCSYIPSSLYQVRILSSQVLEVERPFRLNY